MTTATPYIVFSGILLGMYFNEKRPKRKIELYINSLLLMGIGVGIANNSPRIINMCASGCIIFLIVREDLTNMIKRLITT